MAFRGIFVKRGMLETSRTATLSMRAKSFRSLGITSPLFSVCETVAKHTCCPGKRPNRQKTAPFVAPQWHGETAFVASGKLHGAYLVPRKTTEAKLPPPFPFLLPSFSCCFPFPPSLFVPFPCRFSFPFRVFSLSGPLLFASFPSFRLFVFHFAFFFVAGPLAWHASAGTACCNARYRKLKKNIFFAYWPNICCAQKISDRKLPKIFFANWPNIFCANSLVRNKWSVWGAVGGCALVAGHQKFL